MTSPIQPYPLVWPAMFPRSKTRQSGTFRTTLGSALSNVQTSIKRFGTDSGKRVEDLVISSNVTLGSSKPADPGVAVWFRWDGLQVCIPVDRYTSVESNLQAIHHIVEARRVELRHGTLALVRASLQGFLALPAPSSESWRVVLGVGPAATLADARAAYRLASLKAHPDRGGSHDAQARLNVAMAAAEQELQR